MRRNKEELLKITKQQVGSELTLILEGHLDAVTVKDLNAVIDSSLNGITFLKFDLKYLLYISSAGLRSLLIAQKAMGKQGKMVILNPNAIVLESFHSIGFDRIMTIEQA